MEVDPSDSMELFEVEVEIYNAKVKLLTWLFEEIKMQPPELKRILNKTSQQLPLNL